MAAPTKLSPKERAFCRAYIELNEGQAAAIKAKYAPKSAKVTASRLLTKANVKLEIKRLLEKIEDSALMSIEEADRRLSSLARVNFKAYYDDKGALKQMKDLTDEQAYCLKEVTSIDNEQVKLKTNDPLQALRTIYERRGLLKNQVEGTLKVSFVPSFGSTLEGK